MDQDLKHTKILMGIRYAIRNRFFFSYIQLICFVHSNFISIVGILFANHSNNPKHCSKRIDIRCIIRPIVMHSSVVGSFHSSSAVYVQQHIESTGPIYTVRSTLKTGCSWMLKFALMRTKHDTILYNLPKLSRSPSIYDTLV